MDKRPIGIFDSGVGGLTVYQAVRAALPNEDIIYFADTQRAPFGGKPKETLLSYAQQIIQFLIEQEVKLIIIACNTICAVAYEQLREQFTVPLIELIDLSVSEAVNKSGTQHIGILATEASINSGVFAQKLLANGSTPYPKAAPMLVPLIEAGHLQPDLIHRVLAQYLDPIISHIDTLILGCTHYPHLSGQLGQLYPHLRLINPAKRVATATQTYLDAHHLRTHPEMTGTSTFFTTKDPEKFNDLCATLIGQKVSSIHKKWLRP